MSEDGDVTHSKPERILFTIPSLIVSDPADALTLAFSVNVLV